MFYPASLEVSGESQNETGNHSKALCQTDTGLPTAGMSIEVSMKGRRVSNCTVSAANVRAFHTVDPDLHNDF